MSVPRLAVDDCSGLKNSLLPDCCSAWVTDCPADAAYIAENVDFLAVDLPPRAKGITIRKRYEWECSRVNSGAASMIAAGGRTEQQHVNGELIPHSSLCGVSELLLALSRKSPFLVLSSVLDACVRQRPGSDSRKRLRLLLASVDCGLSVRMDTQFGQLSFPEIWLYRSLWTSGPSETFYNDVIHFAVSDLGQPLAKELAPPLSIDVCLCDIAAKLMFSDSHKVIGIRLVTECLAHLKRHAKFVSIETDSVVIALSTISGGSARSNKDNNFVDTVATALDDLLDLTPQVANIQLLNRLQANASISWPIIVKLYSHARGLQGPFEALKRSGVFMKDRCGDGFSTLTAWMEQLIILGASVKCRSLNPGESRLRTDLANCCADTLSVMLIDETAEIAFVLACSRQLPMLCGREYMQVASSVIPAFVQRKQLPSGLDRSNLSMVLQECMRIQVRAVSIFIFDHIKRLQESSSESSEALRSTDRLTFLIRQLYQCIDRYIALFLCYGHLPPQCQDFSTISLRLDLLRILMLSSYGMHGSITCQYSGEVSQALARIFTGVLSISVRALGKELTSFDGVPRQICEKMCLLTEAAERAMNTGLLLRSGHDCLEQLSNSLRG